MRFGGVRPAYCSIKPGLVWLTTFCGIAASCSVLLLTLAAFGMTNWLNDTAPAWEKRLDAAMTIWIVTLNMAIMADIKYKVKLTESEQTGLNEVSQRGKPSVRTVQRALALLKADEGLGDGEIADVLLISAATVARARKRFSAEAVRGGRT